MIQALWFMVVLAVLVLAGVWLADNPGSVTVQWQGYRLDSSVALLLGAVAAVAVLAALFAHSLSFLRAGEQALKGLQAEDEASDEA